MADLVDALAVSAPHRQRLDFLLAAHDLTAVLRVNRLLNGSRCETSAEHSRPVRDEPRYGGGSA